MALWFLCLGLLVSDIQVKKAMEIAVALGKILQMVIRLYMAPSYLPPEEILPRI
jgi:hypothetical protein